MHRLDDFLLVGGNILCCVGIQPATVDQQLEHRIAFGACCLLELLHGFAQQVQLFA